MKEQLKYHVHHCLLMVDLLHLESQEQVVESSPTKCSGEEGACQRLSKPMQHVLWKACSLSLLDVCIMQHLSKLALG